MHGPPLTPQEAVAAVARHVRRLEALGLDRDHAIQRAAADNGIAPEKARWCAESGPGGRTAATVEYGHGGGQPRAQGERRRHPIHAHKNTTTGTALGPRRPRTRVRLALAAAALTMGVLALGPQAKAQAATINVNPVTGKDTNPATATKPLKTLTRALSKARAGDTVRLAGGGYGPGSSGDEFPKAACRYRPA